MITLEIRLLQNTILSDVSEGVLEDTPIIIEYRLVNRQTGQLFDRTHSIVIVRKEEIIIK